MRLHEWQTNFQHVVLGATSIDALPLLEKNLPREHSMGIYANAYRERLHEALHDNFPALHELLGDDDFAAMAYGFISAQPPQHASIRWFGAELSKYLKNTKPFADVPTISELAQFEWALRHTVDAADAERIDAAYLQSLDAEQWSALRCDLHPSLTLLHFEWNAPQVWRALDANENPPMPALSKNHWLIYRDVELMCQWRSADAVEVTALQCWQHGNTFAEVCDALAQQLDDADAAVTIAAAYMRTWVEQGLLVKAADV